MVKIVDKQNIFNSGIIAPKLHSRDDLKQFNNGIADGLNFICSRYGPIEKRVGTQYVWNLNNPEQTVFFLPFVFSIKQSLLLEFLEHKIRFYTFNGVKFGPIADPNKPGQQYELETPFSAEQIKGISYVQSLDVVYLAFADGKTPPYMLVRYANNEWVLKLFETEDGPYLDKNYNVARKVKILDKDTQRSEVELSGFSLSKKDEGRWIRINTPRYNENTFTYEDKWSYGKIEKVKINSYRSTRQFVYTKESAPGKGGKVYRDPACTKLLASLEYPSTTVSSQKALKIVNTDLGYSAYTELDYTYFLRQPDKVENNYAWKNTYGELFCKEEEAVQENTPLYSTAEKDKEIGQVVKLLKDNRIETKLTLAPDPYTNRPDVMEPVVTMTIRWSFRNKVEETTQEWMVAPTSEWRLGVWHTSTDSEDYKTTFPTKVSIHQQRLVWAGMTDRPWVWTSNSFAYKNYAPSDYEGVINDANSISYDISTDKVSEIFWIKSVKYLLIGTELGELRMYSAGTALTPADVVTNRESSYGSYNGEPVVTDDMIIFIQRLQRTLRSLTYDYNYDAYIGPELTVLAENLTTGGIKKIVYQKEPNNTIWALKENGELLALTYDKVQDVIGWSRCKIAGDDTKVIDLSILPSAAYQQDMLLLAIERQINGKKVRYLELLSRNYTEDVTQEEACFLDCSVRVQQEEPFEVVTGLAFLEGQKVRVTEKGGYQGDYVVEKGEVHLDSPVTDIHVGLAYPAYFETLERDFGDKQLSTKMAKLRLFNMKMYLDRTLGVTVKRLGTGLEVPLITFDPTKKTDTPPSLITGKVEVQTSSAWDCEYRLKVTSEPGLPCNVSGIILGVELNAL